MESIHACRLSATACPIEQTASVDVLTNGDAWPFLLNDHRVLVVVSAKISMDFFFGIGEWYLTEEKYDPPP